MMEDYYRLLGVPRTADADIIKAAYRKQATRWHPDKQQEGESSEAKFILLTEAYKTLMDAGKRSAYDAKLSYEEFKKHKSYNPGISMKGTGFSTGYQPGVDVETIIANIKQKNEVQASAPSGTNFLFFFTLACVVILALVLLLLL